MSKQEHPNHKHRGSHSESEDCNKYKFTNRLDDDVKERSTSVYLCRREHTFFNPLLNQREDLGPWQIPEKKRTSVIILCVCLNIGVDPPGRQKTYPCATQECWIDANKQSAKKAMEMICERLQAQFMRWAPKSEYKILRDPASTTLERTCIIQRKRIKKDRAVFHYNGHGCPDPTTKGEIWVFDQEYTQYLPVSIWDLIAWLDSPTVMIFDCNNAGRLTNTFLKHWNPDVVGAYNNNALLDTIILAACSADEYLPSRPVLPADLFTACLTTPIKTSVVWYVSQHLINQTGTQAKQRKIFNLVTGITEEMIELLFDPVVSGQYTDRRCPLGELNWVFTAITDTIAYEALPQEMFQRLFRSDQALAPLLRNYLLANRIMRSVNRTPSSVPKIPDTSKSPLWQAWDLAIESALNQLKMDFCAAEGKMLLFPPRSAALGINRVNMRTISPQIKSRKSTNSKGRPEQLDFQNNSLIPPQTKILLTELYKVMTKIKKEKTPSRKLMRNLTVLTLRCVTGLSPHLWVAYDRVLKNHGWNGTLYLKPLTKQSLEQLFTSLKIIHNIKRQTLMGKRPWVPLNFFPDQMTAFENWLDSGGLRNKNPLQLPIVLQVLLAQQHRIRAIELLCRFVDLGSWAIHKVLVIGIYPYILRLIRAITDPPRNLRKGLTFLWSKVIVFDPTKARADLMSPKNSNTVNFFINHIKETTIDEPEQLITGFYILATIADGCAEGQKLLLEKGVMELSATIVRSNASAKVRCWASLCIAKLWEGQSEMALMSYNKMHIPEDLVQHLRVKDVLYRACAVHALTCFLGAPDNATKGTTPKSKRRVALDLGIGKQVAKSFGDGSAVMRYEVINHIAKLIYGQKEQFKVLVQQFNQRRRDRKHKQLTRSISTPSISSMKIESIRTGQLNRQNAGNQLNLTPPLSHGPPSPAPTASPISNFNPPFSSQKLVSSTSPADSNSSTNNTINDESRRFIWRVVRVLSADPVEPIRKVARHLIDFTNELNRVPYLNIGRSTIQKSNQRPTMSTNIMRTTSPPQRQLRSGLTVDLDRVSLHNDRHQTASVPKSYPHMSPIGSVTSSVSEAKTERICPKSRLFCWMCDSMLDARYETNHVSLTEDSIVLELTPSVIQKRPSLVAGGTNRNCADWGSANTYTPSGINMRTANGKKLASITGYAMHQPSGEISPGGYIASYTTGDIEGSPDFEDTSINLGFQPKEFVKSESSNAKLEYSMNYVKLSVERHWREFWCKKEDVSKDMQPSERLCERRANFDTKADSVTAIRFHDYNSLLYAADCQNQIWIWDYETPRKLNCFIAKPPHHRGARITTLRVINQLHDSLLLSGSEDGQVLIWRNAQYQDAQTIIGGFVTDRASRQRSYSADADRAAENPEKGVIVHKKDDRLRLPKILMEWDQDKGHLYTGGSILRVFDIEQEQFIKDIRLSSSHLTAMALDPTDHGRLVLGNSEGSVLMVDPRIDKAFLRELKLHEHHVVRTCVQGQHVHSIDPSGLFVVTDVRMAESSGTPLAQIKLKHSLKSFASHSSSKMIATGSLRQFVSLYSTERLADPLQRIHNIRFHEGFLGQRIGPVTHLEFDKRHKLLAVGGQDSFVSIFGPNTTKSIIV